MPETIPTLFSGLIDKFIAYVPDLVAGFALIIVGWLLGWFVKRVIFQVAVILRLERFLIRWRWGREFSRADIRYGLYGLLGNVAFVIIFFVFLDDALSVWRLTVLSDFLKAGIFFFPKLAVSLVIFGIGWLISSWTAGAIQKALRREELPRPTLVARYAKILLLLFFAAMSLAVLDIAREVVLIGFATVFITLGVATVVLTAAGAKEFAKGLSSPETDKQTQLLAPKAAK